MSFLYICLSVFISVLDVGLLTCKNKNKNFAKLLQNFKRNFFYIQPPLNLTTCGASLPFVDVGKIISVLCSRPILYETVTNKLHIKIDRLYQSFLNFELPTIDHRQLTIECDAEVYDSERTLYCHMREGQRVDIDRPAAGAYLTR